MDVILVLDNGRIVETGSHAELMQSGGLYLTCMQARGIGMKPIENKSVADHRLPA